MKTNKKWLFAIMAVLPLVVGQSFGRANDLDRGGESSGGGGGDAHTEMRIDEIRQDILDWINKGGGRKLDFPAGMNYDKYRTQMLPVLARQAVVIGSVTTAEEDATQDPELRVYVDRQPKTCRVFLSSKDGKRHLLCNVERFADTTEAEQYKLIHHEYAGLAGVEFNVGASSDYSLSNHLEDSSDTPVSEQIIRYLKSQPILKLSTDEQESVAEAQDDKDAPMLSRIARAVWDAIKEHRFLQPSGAASSFSESSSLGGVMEVQLRTALWDSRKDQSPDEKDPDGSNGQVLPLWISFAFDPEHPGELAYAKLRGAAFTGNQHWGSGESFVRFFEVSRRIGVNGALPTQFTSGSAIRVDVHQYINVDSRGIAQLYVHGGLNIGTITDSIRRLDLSDHKDDAFAVGETGIRLLKRLLLRARVQAFNFSGLMTDTADSDEVGVVNPDGQLHGWALGYGGALDLHINKHLDLYGDVMRIDTAHLENNEGETSVSSATGGLLVEF